MPLGSTTAAFAQTPGMLTRTVDGCCGWPQTLRAAYASLRISVGLRMRGFGMPGKTRTVTGFSRTPS